jgi:hypothetical protein
VTTHEPTLPSLAVANEAYAHLLNLSRFHPEDEDLIMACETAWQLLKHVWQKETGLEPPQ